MALDSRTGNHKASWIYGTATEVLVAGSLRRNISNFGPVALPEAIEICPSMFVLTQRRGRCVDGACQEESSFLPFCLDLGDVRDNTDGMSQATALKLRSQLMGQTS